MADISEEEEEAFGIPPLPTSSAVGSCGRKRKLTAKLEDQPLIDLSSKYTM